MPSPPRTVPDGLEDIWEPAVEGWRTANRLREEAEDRVAQAASRTRQNAGRVIQQAATTVRRAVEGRRAVQDALFGDRTTGRSQDGPISLGTINKRIQNVQDDVRNGMEGARATNHPAAVAGAWPGAFGSWVGRVREKGVWDDKRRGAQYERQGNFSYGATAAALGIPEQIALRVAGAVQRGQAVGDALSGERGVGKRERAGGWSAPYGDDPRDQKSISEGYAYGGRTAAQPR